MEIMLIPILLFVAVAIALFVVFVATRPSDFKIERSTTTSAGAQVVFDQINNFHNWEAWSPWAKLDPAMQATYSGPDAGVDAQYHWVGNKNVGEGHMKILESRASEHVRIKLDFLKPFAASNITTFSIKQADGGTSINWEMTGTNNFMAKMFGVLMNVDKMVGNDFEKGLAAMKSVVEA